ncbi:MAG TPA: sigma-70 family RNA polymerase sigma factor [Candidatus Udaeobacter sp.]|jgi:RNA polymerase sigma-70 factor (ECF subfamily)|nr:sigma-70 family RNA polymerase sigma factor [Candidatus Udaeobacter sp.]
MLANKQEISWNESGWRSPARVPPALNIQSRADAFATTHWSLVLAAQGQTAAAEAALEELCRIYWRPLYAFARRQACDSEEARDLTQGFFELLLKRRDFDAARKEKGRLRSYLLVSFKHFLGGERRREMTIKRGHGQWLIPLEELHATERAGLPVDGLVDSLSADRLYQRRWASTLIEHVLKRLKNEYRATGNALLFDSLKLLLPDEPDAPSRPEIAARLGMTDNALRQAFHRFRHRYQLLLREEIGHTVADPSEIEDELRQLIVVLRS